MHYHNINEIHDDLQFELKYIHEYSDFIVNGRNCQIRFSTMNIMRMFISWMSTGKNETPFQLSSVSLLSLTYQCFNKFWQENMIKMIKVQTTQTPSTTKPFFSHTSRSKTKVVFYPIVLTYCESVCKYAEENPFHLD